MEPVSRIIQWSMTGRTDARHLSMTLDSFLTIMQRVIVFFSVIGFFGFDGVGASPSISGVIMVGLFAGRSINEFITSVAILKSPLQ